MTKNSAGLQTITTKRTVFQTYLFLLSVQVTKRNVKALPSHFFKISFSKPHPENFREHNLTQLGGICFCPSSREQTVPAICKSKKPVSIMREGVFCQRTNEVFGYIKTIFTDTKTDYK